MLIYHNDGLFFGKYNDGLDSNYCELLNDPGLYYRLVSKLTHLTITWPSILYAASVVSQLMHALRI